MEDLSQQLNQFLSDPNSMRQLQGVLNNLGLGQGQGEARPAEAPPSAPGPDLSALAGALGALGGSGQGAAPAQPANGAGALNPNALAMAAKLAPLLGQINQEDDATRLLRALRPLLSPARQKKIDEAVKILQLMRFLPLLQGMGGLQGLL